MTILCVHLSPLPSSAAAYSPGSGGLSPPSVVAVPERTVGVPGLKLLMKSAPCVGHSTGGDAPICRAVARPRSEQDGTCRAPCVTDIRSLWSKPVLSGNQGNPELFTKVPYVTPRGGRIPLTLRAHARSTRRSSGLGKGTTCCPVAGFHSRHENRLSVSRQSSQGGRDAWGLDLSSGTQPSSLSTSSSSVSTHRARYPPKVTETAATRSPRR